MSTGNEQLTVALTEVRPRPECCLDTQDYGTIALRGAWDDSNSAIKMNLDSLSTLESVRDDECTHASMWGSSITKDMPNLRIRLRQTLESAEREKDDKKDPAPGFVQTCRLVFHELLKVFDETKRSTLTSAEWSLEDILQLDRQLRSLESAYPDAVVELQKDLTFLRLCATDTQNRRHEMQVVLGRRFHQQQTPTIVTDLPVPREEEDSPPSKKQRTTAESSTPPPPLLALYENFLQDLFLYQDFWNELDDLDENAWVLEPVKNRSILTRNILLSDAAKLVIRLDPITPRQRPTSAKFLGSKAGEFETLYDSYSSSWSNQLSVRENLEKCFDRSLARPEAATTSTSTTDAATDCAICFNILDKQHATVECENPSCGRPYHAECLEKWLTSLPTSRTSFDTIIGKCPYCKDPIAVQISGVGGY